MSDTVQTVGIAGLLHLRPAMDARTEKQRHDTALAAAYAQGVGDGETAMQALLAGQRADAARRIAAAVDGADAALAALLHGLSEAMAELGVAVARTVLAAEPGMRPETLQSLILEVLAAAPKEASGTLYVPADALDVAAVSVPFGWQVAADPALSAGTVRAQFDATILTASLERRLGQVAALLGADAA